MLRPIFFDTETTGTRPDHDRIIELAAYDPYRKKSFERLINPGQRIPQDAMNVHQITDEMVQDAPGFKEVVQEFIAFCGPECAIVAHNLENFDLPFIRAECKRCGVDLEPSWVYIDSLIWARRYRKDLPRHSLQFLRTVYGVEANKAHRALNDVIVLEQVFSSMIDDLSYEQVVKLLEKGKKATIKAPEQREQPKEEALSLF